MTDTNAQSIETSQPYGLPPHIWHVVITRFSYRDLSADISDRKGPSSASDENGSFLVKNNIELRSLIFSICCAPSLCSQTNRNFTWIVLISKFLSQECRTRILESVGSEIDVHLHVFSPTDNIKCCAWLEKYVPPGVEYIITTNLDDDDALPSTYISALQSKIVAHDDDLPSMMSFGSKSTLLWDLVSTRRAPLGYRSDWHRGNWVRSPGFSLLVRYSQFCPTVFALDHTIGDIWFEERNGHELLDRLAKELGPTDSANMLPVMEEFVNELRREWSGLIDSAREWMRRRSSALYVELGHEVGPVVMTDHLLNVTSRLWDHKPKERPVYGADSFPNITLNFDVFKNNEKVFRKKWVIYVELWRRVRKLPRGGVWSSRFDHTKSILKDAWRVLRL